MLRKTICTMPFVFLMMGAASAQTDITAIQGGQNSFRAGQEKKAIDREYRSAIKKIPNQKKSDPWGDIRTTPPPAAAKNKQQ